MTLKPLRHIIELIVLCGLCSCHPIENYTDDRKGDFDALWTAVDEHYCFFAEKSIDWNAVYQKYSPAVNENLTSSQFFALCADMVNELRDGHVNLSSGFETSYYRNWWSDYPQNFNLRLIQECYFGFDYKQVGNVIYGILPQNVGYVNIPSFSSGLGNSNIDRVLIDLCSCNGLIIDLRDNGGGSMSFAENWVRHFITRETTVGYMVHKTGPGHNDFDAPYPIKFQPLGENNYRWTKPVVILTNRATYSAGNYMVMCMRALDGVTHAGATTGGGSGMPLTLEIPCGWSVRMSAVRVLDAEGNLTEQGIPPHPGCEVALDEAAALQGHDSMLDFAISLIK